VRIDLLCHLGVAWDRRAVWWVPKLPIARVQWLIIYNIDYTSGQKRVERVSNHQVAVSNDDYVGAASYNIFAGVFVAFIFGAAFFFDLIWPERKESRGVRIAWKVCGVLAVIIHLASAFTITIITATHQSHIRDVRSGEISRELYWWNQYGKHGEAPLDYKHNARAIAAVVFAWLGTCSVIPSCVLLFLSIDNVENGPGPKSRHARDRDAKQTSSDPDLNEKALPEPERAHPPETGTDGFTNSLPAAETMASREG
jgi:uncharacterized membrane protein